MGASVIRLVKSFGVVRAGGVPTERISRPFAAEISERPAAFGCVADVRSDDVRSTSHSGPISAMQLTSANDPKRTFSRICGSAGGYRNPVKLLKKSAEVRLLAGLR